MEDLSLETSPERHPFGQFTTTAPEQFESPKTTPEPANQELLPTSAELELAEDGVEDACDSIASLASARYQRHRPT